MLAELPNHDPDFERWPPAGSIGMAEWQLPGWTTTIWRGVRNRCPHCGNARIFEGFLRVTRRCPVCGAPLGDMPADDTPPYIAMLVVLHVVAFFLVFFFKFGYRPGPVAAVLLLALLAGICCVALRMAKGAVVGILLKLGLKREALRG